MELISSVLVLATAVVGLAGAIVQLVATVRDNRLRKKRKGR